MLILFFCALILLIDVLVRISSALRYLCVDFQCFVLNFVFSLIIFLFRLCYPLLCSISCRLLLGFAVSFHNIYLFSNSSLEFVLNSIRLLVSGLLFLNLNYFSIDRFLAKLPTTMNFLPISLTLIVHSFPSTLQFPYDSHQ